MVDRWINHRNNPQLQLLFLFFTLCVCFLGVFSSLNSVSNRRGFCQFIMLLLGVFWPPWDPRMLFWQSLWLNTTMVNNVRRVWKKNIQTGYEHGADAALLGAAANQGQSKTAHTSHVYKLYTQPCDGAHQRRTQHGAKINPNTHTHIQSFRALHDVVITRLGL